MNTERKSALPLLALALAAFATSSVIAPAPARAADPSSPAGVFEAEVARNLGEAEKKLVELAGAMPAEKFTWRPAEGVRSYAEVTLHVASGNYLLAKILGTNPPEGVDMRTIESSTTDKAKAIEILKASYVHVNKVIAALSAADLDAKVDFFGKSATKREIAMGVISHSHEHLGQSIAYARMNGVVPPWSK